MPESLLLARSLKLLAEIALLAWLGQAALGALLGAGRDRNVVYGLFRAVTSPLRWVSGRWPTGWSPRVRTSLTVVLLLLLWIGALAWKVSLCLGAAACR
ncbi:hypothetical protein [Piscinibacter gummiphilus]|uniref:Uncharacterized protein n=1 Tax=Piscinibacter gummiphilus TaxID=946333 RepID=A0A1W6L8U4_9BURK|nr:hypothetical protein [Piscinibacter gummiphilus]ARN20751.1 hypothetical protein A4W93_13075 [Piscinibacter gummiphilus]ATU65427.1 hypothetical protein CPZ87_13150 [Piscinibacter gummiphilus]GLS94580.1 hypothetical protein GCM10007918_18720 [Piscinibacter gummiphilus]